MIEALKTIKVLGQNVLIQLQDAEAKTSGGIIMPDSAKENATLAKGIVLKKGPGFLFPSSMEQDEIASLIEPNTIQVKYIPLDINEGDTAFFVKEQADPVFIDGIEYFVIPYSLIRLIKVVVL